MDCEIYKRRIVTKVNESGMTLDWAIVLLTEERNGFALFVEQAFDDEGGDGGHPKLVRWFHSHWAAVRCAAIEAAVDESRKIESKGWVPNA
jgi:hypothetical protein